MSLQTPGRKSEQVKFGTKIGISSVPKLEFEGSLQVQELS